MTWMCIHQFYSQFQARLWYTMHYRDRYRRAGKRQLQRAELQRRLGDYFATGLWFFVIRCVTTWFRSTLKTAPIQGCLILRYLHPSGVPSLNRELWKTISLNHSVLRYYAPSPDTPGSVLSVLFHPPGNLMPTNWFAKTAAADRRRHCRAPYPRHCESTANLPFATPGPAGPGPPPGSGCGSPTWPSARSKSSWKAYRNPSPSVVRRHQDPRPFRHKYWPACLPYELPARRIEEPVTPMDETSWRD